MATQARLRYEVELGTQQARAELARFQRDLQTVGQTRVGNPLAGMASAAQADIARIQRQLQNLGRTRIGSPLAGWNAGIGQASAGVSALEGRLRSLSGIAATYVGFSAARGLASSALELSNSYGAANASIRLVSTSMDDMRAKQAELYRIAQLSQTPMSKLAELYQKVNVPAVGLGRNDGVQLTELIAKATAGDRVRNSQGVDAALTQFGQMIGKRVIQGEEVNSIVEGAPTLAGLIVKGFQQRGFTQVRSLFDVRALSQANPNLVNNGTIFDALIAASKETNVVFAAMPRRIQDSLTTVSNSFEQWAGRFDEESGISRTVSGVILGVSGMMDEALKDPSFNDSARAFGDRFRRGAGEVTGFIDRSLTQLRPLWDESARLADDKGETVGNRLRKLGDDASSALTSARGLMDSVRDGITTVSSTFDRVFSGNSDLAEMGLLGFLLFGKTGRLAIAGLAALGIGSALSTAANAPGASDATPGGAPPVPTPGTPDGTIVSPEQAAALGAGAGWRLAPWLARFGVASRLGSMGVVGAGAGLGVMFGESAQDGRGGYAEELVAGRMPHLPYRIAEAAGRAVTGQWAGPGGVGDALWPTVGPAARAVRPPSPAEIREPITRPPRASASAADDPITAANLPPQADREPITRPGRRSAAPDERNGRLSADELVSLGVGNHRASPVLARSYQELAAAAREAGFEIVPSDSYRDRASQERVAREKGIYGQGGLAAVPGTSRHGLGEALDLGLRGPNGQVQRLSDPAAAWLRENGPRFGLETIPGEPWHWQVARPAATVAAPATPAQSPAGPAAMAAAAAGVRVDAGGDSLTARSMAAWRQADEARERAAAGAGAGGLLPRENSYSENPGNNDVAQRLTRLSQELDDREKALAGAAAPYVAMWDREREATRLPALDALDQEQRRLRVEQTVRNLPTDVNDPQKAKTRELAEREAMLEERERGASQTAQRTRGAMEQSRELGRSLGVERDELTRLTEAYGQGGDAVERMNGRLAAERQTRELGRYLPKERADALLQEAEANEVLRDRMQRVQEQASQTRGMYESIGSTGADAFFDIMTSADGAGSSVRSFLKSVSRLGFNQFVTPVFQSLVGGFGTALQSGLGVSAGTQADGNKAVGSLGSSAGSWLGSVISSMWSGAATGAARATGGSVFAGYGHLVGEHGPEMFFPGANGAVLDAGRTRAMMAGGVGGGGTVNVTMNVRTPNPQAMTESRAQIAGRITEAVRAGARNS